MKNVTIVGLGALGSHVVLLARNWECNTELIDFDRVEAKNVQSQFHTELGKGKNKAAAISSTMQGLFKKKLCNFPVKVDAKNVGELLEDTDLVIDCTDNLAARTTIIEHVTRNPSVACLHGCLSADGSLGRVIWTENFRPDPEGEEGQATCENGENLWFHAMVGAVIVSAAGRFLKSGEKRSYQITHEAVVRLT